jgi:succinate-semialdehyde dehydrogenase/glutarate-semialdehyde dehydrogenase
MSASSTSALAVPATLSGHAGVTTDRRAILDAGLFIGGAWLDGAAGILPNVDPGNGTTVGQVSLADPAQVDAALDAATAAFPSWSATLPGARGKILCDAADRLADRIDEATDTILLETGKTAADARGEILRAVANLRWNGEQAARISGTSYVGVAEGSRRSSIPTPLGVVAAVTAWNFPAVLTTRKLGAILAAGCTVVLKASEFAPATARLIVEVLAESGLPAGVVNLLFGHPTAVTEQILASPVVKALTFTGSTAVGRQLTALAAPQLIRPVLELGGHAPVIVWSDADIDHVVAVTGPAKFGSAGQSCVAPSRYIVHRSLASQLTEALVAKAESLTIGHGHDPQVTLGAVAHQGRVDALVQVTEDALARGASLATGGHQVDRDGFYFEPTIITDVPGEAAIMTEEPFGPIAAVTPVDDLDSAIELANSAPYSFAAYLFTDSLAVRNTVVARLNASNIGINQTAPSLPDVPLGGLGYSGYGYEGGTEGILAFTQLRLVSETA